MLLLLAIALIVMLFVVKRPVNTSSLHASWTPPIEPATPAAPKAAAPSSQPPVAQPPVEITTMNFNDIFAPKPAPKSDQPRS